jgi:hypothetical protein
VNEESKLLSKEYDKSENDLKALQSVGQVKTFFSIFKTIILNNEFPFFK